MAFSTGLAKAETSSFVCTGKNYFVRGENIYAPANSSSENTFDLVVNSKNPDIYGYPKYVVMACINSTSDNCSISPTALICKCQSNTGRATIDLSRNSGKLSVIQTFPQSKTLSVETVMLGEYMCSKVTKKLF